MSPKTSLAAVMTSPRQTELRELPLPDIPSDAGLLRVVATGICGSDLHGYRRASPFGAAAQQGPRENGHELMGMFQRPQGPWLGKVKGYLRDLVIDGELDQNDKERGAELARAYMAEHPEL